MNLMTPAATSIKTSEQRLYGILSWSFVFACIAVSLVLLLTHGLIQSVKAEVFTVAQLESIFFPGIYWILAAACIALLAVSAILIGLTTAIVLIRTCMLSVGSCRLYWLVLFVQLVPWFYFFVSTA